MLTSKTAKTSGGSDENVKRIWISWESQRRTITLSEAFKARLFILESRNSGLRRYAELIFKTIRLIKRQAPDQVFVQNPSIVLAALVCFLKKPLNFTAIVDRHTNFKLDHRASRNPKWLIFFCLSNYSLRHADFTIVTNGYLKLLINGHASNVLVLPDRIPSLPHQDFDNPHGSDFSYRALFVCTFADDEPFREVFEAVRGLPQVCLQVTGNYKKALEPAEIDALPGNVKLLGFVSNQSYVDHLFDCDFTVVLTKQEFTLNCGAYESLAAGKPMLLSNTRTIRSYFSFGANYVTQSSVASIREELTSLVENLEAKQREIATCLPEMRSAWEQEFMHAATRFSK